MANEIRRLPGDVLLHWSVPLAIVVLLLNDHWAKERWGNAATGKVSDLAGMYFGPILVVALWELARRRPVPTSTFAVVALTLGIAFAVVKVVPAAADLVEQVHGAIQSPLAPRPTVIVGDPTDALALVTLLPAVVLWHRQEVSGTPLG